MPGYKNLLGEGSKNISIEYPSCLCIAYTSVIPYTGHNKHDSTRGDDFVV